MANNSHEFRLESLAVLDKYIALLTKEEDELFKHLNLVLQQDRSTSDSDEWNDKNHYTFTEECIVPIQSKMLAVTTAYEDAIHRLKELRQQYALVM